ncbi:hypothetical protein DFH28DRAFT_286155 [Melampsora americana]|nr:hypothetical protein DFH28DRAFT_286155 [Melampsora americana]
MGIIRLLQGLPLLPLNVNPYDYLKTTMQAVVFPTVPPSDPVFVLLITFAVVYVVIFCLAVSLVAIPFTRNQAFQQKHLWLWRKERVTQNNQIYSYYIPNPGMAVAISQIFASILAEIIIVLSYMNFQSSQFSQRSYVSMWLVVSYVPGFFGFWLSGWSALYIYILSPGKAAKRNRSSKKIITHPLLLNTLCIGVPIVVLFVASGYGIASFFFFRSEREAFVNLISTFEDLSAHWTPPTTINRHIDYDTLMSVASPFHQTSQSFLTHFRTACLIWSIFLIIAVLFYTITVVLLLKLMKKSIAVSRETAVGPSLDFEMDKGHSEATCLTDDRATIPILQAQKLRKKYLFLVVRCMLVTLLLLWYVVTGLILSIKAEEILITPTWRVTSAWVIVFSAAFLSLSLLIQSCQMLLSKEGSNPKLKISNPILLQTSGPKSSAPASIMASVSTAGSPQVQFQTLDPIRENSVLYITLAPFTPTPLPSPSFIPIPLPLPSPSLSVPPELPPLRSTSLPLE